MNFIKLNAVAVLLFVSTQVLASGSDEHVVQMTSAHSVSETMDRLEKIVRDKGMNVFARIDHASGAKKAGLSLAPSQVLIFGNPKLGTSLMNCEGAIALDLPIRVAVWENSKGEVMLAYNAPSHLKHKYHVKGCDGAFDKMSGALTKFTGAATK